MREFIAERWAMPTIHGGVMLMQDLSEITIPGYTVFEGGSGADRLSGTVGDDQIWGYAGNDTLLGYGGDDVLYGGSGADILDGGAGINTAVYYSSDVGVVIDLKSGIGSGGDAQGDKLINIQDVSGSDYDDKIYGTDDGDYFYGAAGDDAIYGRGGDDFIFAGGDGRGADRLDGGDGIDIVSYAYSGAVQVDLLAGTGRFGEAEGDTLFDIENLRGGDDDDVLGGNDSANVLEGGRGRDTLNGRAGADTLNGGEGSDSLDGGAGADVLIGGSGSDTIVYDGPAGVTVNLTTLTASGGDAEGDTIGSDIENIRGTTGFRDVLTGSAVANVLSGDGGSDVLDGMAGSDTLDGGSGNDQLRGGAGVDALYGGSGVDTASYDGSAAGVSVSLLTGIGNGGDAQGDTLDGVENLSGSQANDNLAGNAGANILRGGDGNDVLRGGAGADRLDGGAGTDTASYNESTAGVTVDLAVGTGFGGNAQGDTLVGIENLTGSNQGNDSLSGNAGANTLAGWGGDDMLRGGAGADRLDGGVGVDTVSYYAGAVGVTVNLATGIGTGGDAQGDVLVSIENVAGSTGADQITGDALANVLNGSAGRDVLTGGAGADRFVLTAVSHSAVGAADRITDFNRAQGDRVDLSAIDADTAVAGDQAFTFIGGGAFTHQAGQLRAATSPGVTTIAGDLNGDGVSDFHIQLTGAVTLQASDFVL